MAAGKADGTIVIVSKIETDGFVKGTKELENACRRAAASVENIGEKTRISLEKSVDAFAKQNDAYRNQQVRVEELKQAIDELGKQKVETPEFKQINAEIDKIQKKIDSVIEKEIRFLETGGSTETSTFARMEYDIETLRKKIKEANAEKQKLISSGGAYTSADTSSLASQLAAETEKLDTFGRRLDTSYAALTNRIQELTVASDQYEKELSDVDKGSRKTAKSVDRLGKSARKTQSGFKMGARTFLRYFIGVESLFRLVSLLRREIGEGVQNLVQFDNKTNQSVSGILTSAKTLKNNIAAALAPLINTVAPMIIRLIEGINNAVTKLGMFIAYLTGQKTYTKAVTVWQDYAESLDDVSASAKAALKNLSGLDEIRTFDSGKSSGSTNISAKDMFETKELTEEIQIAFDNITVEDIGANLGKAAADKINEATDWIDNQEWDKLGEKFTTALLNVNWASVGSKILEFSGAISKGLYELLKGVGKALWNDITSREGNIGGWLSRLQNDPTTGEWEGYLNAPGNILINLINQIIEANSQTGVLWQMLNDFANDKKIEQGFQNISNAVGSTFDNLRAKTKTTVQSVNKDFDSLLDTLGVDSQGIRLIFSGLTKFIGGTVSGDLGMYWEGMKEMFAGVGVSFEETKESIVKTFKDMKSGIKTPINGVIDFLNRLISGVVSAMNETVKALNNLSFDVPDWIPKIGGKSFGFNLKTITPKTIPKLATGAVIPPNAPFYAMLGDQKHGTNIEAPLDTIKQALREVLGTQGQGGNTYNITATARGRALFELIIAEGRGELVRTGKNPFDLVTT